MSAMPVKPPRTSISMILSGFSKSTFLSPVASMPVTAASMSSCECRLVKRFSTVTLNVSFSWMLAASSEAARFTSSRVVGTTFSMGIILRA